MGPSGRHYRRRATGVNRDDYASLPRGLTLLLRLTLRGAYASRSTARTCPGCTGAPGCTRIDRTTPEALEVTLISVFIASTMATGSPSATTSPGARSMRHRLPATGLVTATQPSGSA